MSSKRKLAHHSGTASAPGQFRPVKQTPRHSGHVLQRRWSNPGAFYPRISQLAPYVRGRTVLDVGCASGLSRPDWVHAGLARLATTIVGVDIDAGAVDRARAKGFDVRIADAESLDVSGQWQVVHAGELLEHLDNPRAFLDAVRQRLTSDGLLLVTTPNPFAISNFVYRMGGTPRVNGDHVAWYCEDTMRQLLERNEYEVVEITYLRHDVPGSLRSRLASMARRVLPKRLAWNTLLAVARSSRIR
jgi:2-polyprenyl-3-methyl-5-hydroxy-6-metoxy-1,4-benzoquinol methylase